MAKKKINGFALFICCLLSFAVGIVGGVVIKTSTVCNYEIPKTQTANNSSAVLPNAQEIKNKDLSIHFIELGNKYTGDCTFIKVGETEILIDAGSRADSVKPIYEYIAPLIDGNLDYAIVTHAHQDHYAGFATGKNTDSIFDLIKTDTVIKFSKTNQKAESGLYSNFIRELDESASRNGTKVYDALQCWNNESGAKREYALSETVKMEILYQKYYTQKAKTENDYSVCIKISQNQNGKTYSYLFTGDLEKEGEESLVESNDIGECVLYKAGHHGSKTSSTEKLLSVIKPEIVCVCACAGSTEYTTKNENTFPTQQFIDNVAKYTDEVYVTTLCTNYKAGEFTSMNGNIVISTPKGKNTIEKYFSASTAKLKDTEWFKNCRICPEQWKQ